MFNVLISLRNWLLAAGLMLLGSLSARGSCPLLYTFTGEGADDTFGQFVASAGDVNNDGVDDIIIGAYLNGAGAVAGGRAYVFSGSTGDTLHVFTGDSAHAHLGRGVSGAGDVDKDGFDDLLVAASSGGPSGQSAGRVRVYSGQTGSLLYELTGEVSGDRFGMALAGLGDIDGDSASDFVVGAYGNDAAGDGTGAAYIFSGATGDPLFTFIGEAGGDWFGAAVDAAGDVNNDGIGDIIIGAPFNDAAGISGGRAYVFSGGDGDTLHVFTAAAAQDEFGAAVTGLGDVDGDGFGDLAISETFDLDNNNRGRIHVFSGDDGSLLYFRDGEADFDEFGSSVTGIADYDGDGLPDMVVGTRYGGPAEAGRTYAFTGFDGTPGPIFSGVNASDFHGLALDGAGDMNDDGWPELIVGSPGNDSIADGAGAVFVYTLSPDPDADSIPSACDNCTHTFNPDQIDTDGDGIGEACEGLCDCPFQCDFDEDTFITPIDLSAEIDILFASHPDVQDPICSVPRADFDCDGFSTSLDLSGLIDHLFASGDGPCDPCFGR